MPELHLTALADADPQLAESAALKHGLEVCSPSELIGRDDIELIHIASPPATPAMRESRLKWESTTPLFTPQAGEKSGSQFYVGCSGWFYWHWRGGFYPADLPTTKWFSHYTEHFNTVELNAPFYSWPTLSTVRTWLRQLKPHDFVYTVKVCELIAHTKRFARTGSLIQDFGHIADLLGPRMGCFLFQLPPSFRYSPDRLRSILGKLDPRRRNVVEFRDRAHSGRARPSNKDKHERKSPI